jgi:hypothetical protein
MLVEYNEYGGKDVAMRCNFALTVSPFRTFTVSIRVMDEYIVKYGVAIDL